LFEGGYTGRILRINLTDKTSRQEELPFETAKDYLGGAGFGVKYLFKEVKAESDALGPENKLIFAVGPFTGSFIPCASRMAVTAKSPLTNAIGVSLTGGHFPAELKFAGYDALIIEGKAHGLNYATAYNGADHNRGYAFQEIQGIPIPYPVNRFATEGKGVLTKLNQDVATATCDCPPMCTFLMIMAFPGNAPENTGTLMQSISGMAYTPEEIEKVGERVVNLARAFNVREGFTREDDTLPERLMTEPLPNGPSKGRVISKEDLEQMLDEYYTVRGWDVTTGIPTREKLIELGLEDVSDELGV